jgi:ATP-binding cassette subfamily B protein
MIKIFTHYKQLDQKDCGPTCLKIIARHYQQSINIQRLRILSETIRTGSNLQGVSNAAEAIGFRSLGVKIDAQKLEEAPLPCILHWNKNHYVVLYKVSRSKKCKWRV